MNDAVCQVASEFKLQNGIVTAARPETKLQKGLNNWSKNYDIRILNAGIPWWYSG